ncbi:hypothetical protein Y032_0018g3611 [Ancylostoma ceylanicum]|uniref:Uncharacterized protein n=1 Tax=Ancylostoma ceylanicum TaxID=53326 RepID=A0A016V3U0_9BILA|nr:hypothetical protein Y032_0018g3611 [Ancylostoma ceylanicum]
MDIEKPITKSGRGYDPVAYVAIPLFVYTLAVALFVIIAAQPGQFTSPLFLSAIIIMNACEHLELRLDDGVRAPETSQ